MTTGTMPKTQMKNKTVLLAQSTCISYCIMVIGVDHSLQRTAVVEVRRIKIVVDVMYYTAKSRDLSIFSLQLRKRGCVRYRAVF